MSTGTTIIKRALQKIGASSAVQEPTSEAFQTGLEVLNAMLSTWKSQNLDTGSTLLKVAGDELNEKQDCQNAIILNLAVLLVHDFGSAKVVATPDLKKDAFKQLSDIKSIYQTIDIPQKVVSSTLPMGAGNRRFLRSQAFFAEGDTIGN